MSSVGPVLAGATPQEPAPRPGGAAPATGSVPDAGTVILGPPAPIAPEVITRDEQGRATVRAVRLTQPLQFDGRLDEAVYDSVKPITGFVQSLPDNGKPVSQTTEVWVFFDSKDLYVACRCWDTAPPSQWVANEMRRDSNQIRQNDGFGVMLDTFYDRRNAVNMVTNPLGGILDSQYTNEGNANQDWNAVWDVRTARFEGGWSLEMRIPFKSLRYRPGASQVWGIQFRRVIRRRNESAFLTPLPPDGSSAWQRISLSPTLVGLDVPPGSRNLDIKPYGIGGMRTDRTASPVVSNDPGADFGLDVKYGLTQNLTLDFTYNTDFAQVEVDEQQVNLTRFNLVFPEKREFFLEGRGLYEFGHNTRSSAPTSTSTMPELFFSRQIGLNAGRVVPIEAGMRLTGKVGKSGFGVLNLQTDNEPVSKTARTNFTVFRFRRDILRRSTVGLLLTNRSAAVLAPRASNQAYGADASFSFYENVNLNGFLARTETPGLAGEAKSYRAHFDYSPDRYGAVAEHEFVGDAFNPEVGFVPRDDMRRTFVSGRVSPSPKSLRSVRRFVWEGSLEYIADTAGRLKSRRQTVSFNTEFRSSDLFTSGYDQNYERLLLPFKVSGVTIPVGEYSFDTVHTSYSFGQQRKWSGLVSLGQGGFYGGRQTSLDLATGRVEIRPQFSVEPSMTVNRISLPYGVFTTQIYRARTTYTFTPRMFVSGLLQYNSSTRTMSTNGRLRWEYTPGSEFFVVYTDDRATAGALARQFSQPLNRALVIKFNRLLRF